MTLGKTRILLLTNQTQNKVEKYLVFDQNNKLVLTEDELLNFIRVAVIQNKDISSFSVQRIGSEPTRMQVVEAAFIRIFNI